MSSRCMGRAPAGGPPLASPFSSASGVSGSTGLTICAQITSYELKFLATAVAWPNLLSCAFVLLRVCSRQEMAGNSLTP